MFENLSIALTYQRSNSYLGVGLMSEFSKVIVFKANM